MVALTWLRGLLARRRGTLLATAAGVAVGVALLASVGTFLSATTSKMTERAIGRVPVDWQVQASNGTSPSGVLAKVRSQPGVEHALAVGFASTPGFSASSGGSTQTTGPGRVLALPPGYASAFPGELRMLSGSSDGALLAQQTAANLHARPGDLVRIGRAGGTPARVRVAGIVDLPAADSLFQQVGAPVGAQPQAPPDNVVLLPRGAFDRAMRGVPVTTQVHARISHRLPGSPSSAFTRVSGAARNLETRLAGAGLVGDNLGSALDQARGDALYAQLLFLFLGVPGAVLAGAAHRVDRLRRRRPPPPRLRAAAHPRRFDPAARAARAGGDSPWPAASASRPASRARSRSAQPRSAPPASAPARSRPSLWAGGAALAGPRDRRGGDRAARVARRARADRRRPAPPGRAPRPRRRGGRATGSTSSRSRAPRSSTGRRRGTATSSCSRPRASRRSRSTGTRCWRRCSAGSAPACSPTGSRTSCSRAAARPLARALRPVAGELSPTVAATMGRQRRLLARTVALVALDGRVRRLHRDLQLHLQAAGRGRRPADERCRRDGHRVARRERRPGRRPRGSRRAGRGERRAAAAPLRLRRRRPAGPLRRAPAHDRRGRQAPGRLVPGRQREGADGAARASDPTRCWWPPRP